MACKAATLGWGSFETAAVFGSLLEKGFSEPQVSPVVEHPVVKVVKTAESAAIQTTLGCWVIFTDGAPQSKADPIMATHPMVWINVSPFLSAQITVTL